MTRTFSYLLLTICFLFFIPLFAQNDGTRTVDIEKLIAAKRFKQAQQLLDSRLDYFLQKGSSDSLPNFIAITGRLAFEQSGKEKAIDAVRELIKKIKAKPVADSIILDSYMNATDYLGGIGQNKQAFDLSKESMAYAQKVEPYKRGSIANIENNLGVYAHRLGNTNLSYQHHTSAITLREQELAPDPVKLYKSYNAMAGMMWSFSKLDSATYYYNKALQALAKCPPSDVNKYYRPAVVNNNNSAVYNAQGNISKAIEAQQQSIHDIQSFIASKEESPQKKDAPIFLMEAIDNLSGFYRELGNYDKARDLLLYSYNRKKLEIPGQPGVFISELLLGQLYNSMRKYEEAEKYLKSGLEKLTNTEGDYLFWAADGYYSMAMVNKNTNRQQDAAICFSKSDSLYELSYQGQYDDVYLDFLRNAAEFYAGINEYDRAIAFSNKGYKYIVSVQGEKSLATFNALLNLAEINYITGRYKLAEEFSNKSLSILADQIKSSASPLDSVKIELNKPKAILMNIKSGYALREVRDTVYLHTIARQLNDAIQMLEKRKTFIDDENSINLLIEENRDLIAFARKISLDLFNQTGNEEDLNDLMGYHESGLYNRIRARLDNQRAIRFNNIPLAIQREEDSLQAAIPAALNKSSSSKEQMNTYMDAVNNREKWLEKIKTQYPQYFNMRYASLFKSLPQLKELVPANSTVVRYFFSDDELYALLFDKDKQQLIPLGKPKLNELINTLLSSTSEEKIVPVLHQLYQQLWQPFASKVNTSRVIIIPDGILFNLSFELLTPSVSSSFSQLADSSLLSLHSFSYQYSLFMLEKEQEKKGSRENYIVFAPGFSENNKNEYRQSIKDSIKLDQQYLELLPQPFTNELARKMKNQFGGKAFLDESSTIGSFRQYAANHKIVHIGTHGEFNNERPERSRIIFSKSSNKADESNALFLSDIYNCDISSDLTLLTACESGKPGYDDGEGMISFAHAFNYAGSKSILTGLWKIDEQSTSMITEQFLKNLSQGLASDEALRNAKLHYLRGAKGRMQAPAYWAGLVLLGNISPIDLEKEHKFSWWWVAGGILLIVGVVVVFTRRKS